MRDPPDFVKLPRKFGISIVPGRGVERWDSIFCCNNKLEHKMKSNPNVAKYQHRMEKP